MPEVTIQQAFDLALEHHQAGRLNEAESIYRQILAVDPSHVDSLHLLGVMAHEVGRADIAVDLIRRAIALRPFHHVAHNNLGNALQDHGQLDAAVAAYRQALAVKPSYPEAHYNLGNALLNQGQFGAAITAYRHALALNPNFLDAQSNLGLALQKQGQLDAAIAAYRQALAVNPNDTEVHNNLGLALQEQGQLDAAVASYRQALALKSSYPEVHSNLIFCMNHHHGLDASAIAEEARRWNTQHAEPLGPMIQPHPNDRTPDRRLRIGYVSPDFREHAVSRFMLPLLAHHDPRNVETYAYAQVSVPDAVTARLQGYTSHWHSIVGLTDQQVAELIRRHQIDILVDLACHTAGNRLLVFAHKPAPVQVTYLGYPGTTGLSAIDYRLSDPYLDPTGIDESVYSEKTYRLPHTFWCYDPPASSDLPVNGLPVHSNGHITFGCLNNFCKVTAPTLTMWAALLLAVPEAELLVHAAEGSHRQRTADQLARLGVDPFRISFAANVPLSEYMQLYHQIDIALDPFPYGGGTTTCDALWMGVPVISCAGTTAVSRAGSSLLSNVGLPELIAQTPDEYVRIAAELANDLPRLAELRAALRQRMQASPLMDAPRFARDIEAAYRAMWHQWCKSSPIHAIASEPEPMDISETTL